MNSLKNNNKLETKVESFEQMPELIQNLVERTESLEKTVREKQQPQPVTMPKIPAIMPIIDSTFILY